MSEVIAKFPNALDSYAIDLQIENMSNFHIRSFGLSSLTARFPVTWDSVGSFNGPATLVKTTGLDTNVVFFKFSGFSNGETVKFKGMDPDFTGDISSGVHNIDIEGSTAIVQLSNGETLFGKFEVDHKGDLTAILTKK
ncbi:hypothetical protein [Spartinivicinus ruber]|uniref:hypothetical protein n=1 Tax=Spartinivicinus ruber TaxID=2683272 RepID=UPI0013D78875|nr:hypothetical protein [Spartinivicinus ruber]